MTVKALVEEAQKLTPYEWAELLDELICIIHTTDADVALTPAQAADLERRREELRQGKPKLIPGDQAIAGLRRRS